jgi:hypothetical protein
MLAHRCAPARLPDRARAAIALAALGACGGGSGSNDRPSLPPSMRHQGLCTNDPPMPSVHIGPDVDVRAVCGAPTTVPVASVDEQGAGATRWSATIVGDPALSVAQPSDFTTCSFSGPNVASVLIVVPPDAMPGDVYDGVVTVTATDGSFPTGTVKVHAVVAAPTFTVTPEVVEFGDVAAGKNAQRNVTFVSGNSAVLGVVPTTQQAPPFFLSLIHPTVRPQLSQLWSVSISSATPGDYTQIFTWTAGPSADAGSACTWMTTLPVHARVLDDGGRAGPDATDGGVGPLDGAAP